MRPFRCVCASGADMNRSYAQVCKRRNDALYKQALRISNVCRLCFAAHALTYPQQARTV